MSLHYIRHRSAEVYRDEVSAVDRRVVLYDLNLEQGHTDLENCLAELHPEYRDTDAIILRASRGVDLPSLRSAALTQFATTPTWVLIRSDGPMTLERLTAELDEPPVSLEELRALEMEGLFHHTRSIHTEPDTHYVLPSQLHADHFINVADLMRDISAVHRVADWIEDDIDEQTVLVTDTGALLPLMIELRARAWEHRGFRTGLHVLDEYPDTILVTQEGIRRVQSRDQTRRILFILSVSSSGTLASWVRLAAPTANVLSLCDTATTPHTHTLLHFPITHIAHPTADDCKLRKIAIDRRTLERIYEASWQEIELDKGMASRDKAFWEIADRTNAVHLHVDRSYWAADSRVRHHPVHIDVYALLSDQTFRDGCVAELRQKLNPPPDLLILPTHDESHEAIHDLVREAFGEMPEIRTQGTIIPPESEKALSRASRILIADDEIVSGRTLAGLRRVVYRHIQARTDKVEVFGFVVLERPPTRRHRTNTRNAYREGREGKDQLIVGQRIYLPSPTKRQCPWCEEKRLLNLFAEYFTGEAEAYAAARIEKLRGSFLPPVPLGADSLPPEAVTKDGFFGDLRHLAAVGAVSSVIMKMQEHDLRPKEPRYPIFKASSGLSFYDAVLTGTIFRTLRARDLRWVDEVEVIETTLRDQYDQYAALPGFFAEVGLAAVEGKLPRKPVEEILATVTNDAAVTLMQQILHLRPELSGEHARTETQELLNPSVAGPSL